MATLDTLLYKEEQKIEESPQIEKLYGEGFVSGVGIAMEIKETSPDEEFVFLIDVDSTLTTGWKATAMKFPFAHKFITSNDFISDSKIQALGELNDLNMGGVAIVTNRIAKSIIWKSERIMADLRRKLSNFELDDIPIFTDTDRMVPESLRTFAAKHLYRKEDRFEKLIALIESRRVTGNSLTICIISDFSIPEALTEMIYMKELLKRVPGAKGNEEPR